MNPSSRMLLPLRRTLQNQFRRKLSSKTAAEPNLNDEPTEGDINKSIDISYVFLFK